MMTKQPLPKGWRWVKLGDYCQQIDYGYTASANFNITEPRFLRITDIQNGNVVWEKVPGCEITPQEEKSNLLVDGDIVFARTGATTGKSFLIKNPPRAVFASYLIRVRPISQIIPDFLYVFFQSDEYWRQIKLRARGGAQPNVNASLLSEIHIPLAPLEEQKRIAARLDEQMRHIEQARQGIEDQLSLLGNLVNSYLRESLQTKTRKMRLSDCMVEVKKGVGETWAQYPVLGATRAGVAPAKEKVGKQPQRYKLVEPGTIFYNPMRIMIGSIAMLDDGDETGITSPDYVVLKGKEGILHPRWFYHWFRSPYGENFIKSFARGAVRERMLFNRLDKGEIELPDWETQVKIAEKLKEIKTFKQALESQLAEIESLPSAVLGQAFAGG